MRFRIEAELARARAFGAIAVDAERPGEFAIGVIRAADERAEAPELQPQPAGAAHRADARIFAIARIGKEMLAETLVERVDDVADLQVLGAADRRREIAPEILQHLLPGDAAAGNLVQLILEIGSEIVFDVAFEEFAEECRYQPAAILGNEALFVEPHIFAILQHLDNRRVGRRPADAQLFELLDETRFGVAGRRLGEMLLTLDLAAIQGVALL